MEFKSVLAPIDFSAASRHGVQYAADVAARFQSRLHLLYVVEPPSLPEWGYAHLPIKEAKLRTAAEERLPQFCSECGIDPSLIETATVRAGDAELAICEAAAERRADLIVMASHGLGGVKHAFLGSTSEGVARRSSCAVLTVRDRVLPTDEPPRSLFAPRLIMVTTDFSNASKSAFPYATTLARKFDASLMLVYVVPSHLPAEISQLGMLLEEEVMLSQARKQLPLFRQAEFESDARMETIVLNGSPAHEICVAAKARSVDLIIMAAQGHSGLKRFALGSVTENVARRAPCPVLSVRQREHQAVSGG